MLPVGVQGPEPTPSGWRCQARPRPGMLPRVEWFNAVSGLIGHIAWPIVVVVIVLVFRRPLGKRLAQLLSIETPAGTITFAEQVEKVAEVTFETAASVELAGEEAHRTPVGDDGEDESPWDTVGLPIFRSMDLERELFRARQPDVLKRRAEWRGVSVAEVQNETRLFELAAMNPSRASATRAWLALQAGALAAFGDQLTAHAECELELLMPVAVSGLYQSLSETFKREKAITAGGQIWTAEEARVIIQGIIFLSNLLDDLGRRQRPLP
jgi:hypothetical protein